MKKFTVIIFIFLIYCNSSFSDGHKTKFKDIKGFKKQFISMHKKKVNRIKEVKKSDGYPVYEGKTSIQFTVNREDAGCGTGKAQTTQIQCDGKGNRSRQVNIAMVNELAILSNMLDIDIWEVVEAAKTKPFGFQSFRPGPGVGGHCIPIDPKYLSFKTRQVGQPVRFVELAQEINNSMPNYVVVGRISELMNRNEILLKNSKILILGVAYKKDIGDTRESPALDIIESLLEKSVDISFYDPHVDELVVNKNSISSEEKMENLSNYDLILIHTPHTKFHEINFESVNSLIFDSTGSFEISNAERI